MKSEAYKTQIYLRDESVYHLDPDGPESFECELRRHGLIGEITPANIARCFDVPLEYGEKVYRNYLSKKANQI